MEQKFDVGNVFFEADNLILDCKIEGSESKECAYKPRRTWYYGTCQGGECKPQK